MFVAQFASLLGEASLDVVVDDVGLRGVEGGIGEAGARHVFHQAVGGAGVHGVALAAKSAIVAVAHGARVNGVEGLLWLRLGYLTYNAALSVIRVGIKSRWIREISHSAILDSWNTI